MRPMTELEVAVMDVLWAYDRGLVGHEVLEGIRMKRHQPLAYTTVMTVLGRLVRKGLVRRQEEGRAHRYWPVCAREQHAAAQLERLLAASGDREATLAEFVQQMRIEDRRELRRALGCVAQR